MPVSGSGRWPYAASIALNADSFEQALQALQTMKADGGRPLGLGTGGKSTLLLVVPSTLNGAARKVIGVSELPGGGTNPWYDVRNHPFRPVAAVGGHMRYLVHTAQGAARRFRAGLCFGPEPQTVDGDALQQSQLAGSAE